MKRFLKAMALVLVILQLVPALIACKNGDNPGEVTTTPSGEEVTTPEETTGEDISSGINLRNEDGSLKYATIKYPEDPEETTFEAVKKLRDKLREYTGTSVKITPDYSSESRPADSSTFEILVGETNYPESKEALEGLNYGDYRITVIGNKIVIAAYSSDEISRAVNYITSTMFKEKDENGNRILKITDYEYNAKRYINNVTINGHDAKEYTIVYGTKGNDKDYNLVSARLVRQAFSEKAGYLLPILADSDVDKCTTARKIYIGSQFKNSDTTADLHSVKPLCYMFKEVNQDFYIMGGGLLSGQLSATEFVSEYFNVRPSDGKVTITDKEGTFRQVTEDCPLTTGSEFRVMTYNIMAQWSGWGGDYMPVEQRFEAFASVMDMYSPDVVGLQEVSELWSNKILAEYGDEYEYIYRKTPDDKFVNLSTIIYKKSKFDVVDKGLQYFSYNGPNQIRLVTWVILKDKATGKQFAFFNTHWMFNSTADNDGERKSHAIENAEIINNVMTAHPQVKHCFSTADYNTTLGHQYFTQYFLKNTGMVNTLDIAKAAGTLKNEVGGCGTLGVSRYENTGGGSIDNIFCSNNMEVLRHETILWNCVEHVSDHSPKYADIVLKD